MKSFKDLTIQEQTDWQRAYRLGTHKPKHIRCVFHCQKCDVFIKPDENILTWMEAHTHS